MNLPKRPELLLLLGAVVFGLAIAELGLRLYGALGQTSTASEVSSDPLAVKVRAHGKFGFRQRPNSVYKYPAGVFATSNGQGFRGPTVDSIKQPGTVRVLLLGSSTTHGWGVGDDSTIDAFMRRELAARHPKYRFEVLNLAFDGYDSYQVLQRLRTDGLPRDPDVVISNISASDVASTKYRDLKYGDERTLIWEGVLRRLREEAMTGPSLRTLAKHYLYLARVPSMIRVRLALAKGPARVAVIRPNMKAAEYLERNLDEIVALSSAIGACVFLSTDPSGLRWYPPDATSESGYWVGNAATTQTVRDTMDTRVRRAVQKGTAAGKAVQYVGHNLGRDGFLDDAHLSAKGNRAMAHDFVEALGTVLPRSRFAGKSRDLPACTERARRPEVTGASSAKPAQPSTMAHA